MKKIQVFVLLLFVLVPLSFLSLLPVQAQETWGTCPAGFEHEKYVTITEQVRFRIRNATGMRMASHFYYADVVEMGFGEGDATSSIVPLPQLLDPTPFTLKRYPEYTPFYLGDIIDTDGTPHWLEFVIEPKTPLRTDTVHVCWSGSDADEDVEIVDDYPVDDCIVTEDVPHVQVYDFDNNLLREIYAVNVHGTFLDSGYASIGYGEHASHSIYSYLPADKGLEIEVFTGNAVIRLREGQYATFPDEEGEIHDILEPGYIYHYANRVEGFSIESEEPFAIRMCIMQHEQEEPADNCQIHSSTGTYRLVHNTLGYLGPSWGEASAICMAEPFDDEGTNGLLPTEWGYLAFHEEADTNSPKVNCFSTDDYTGWKARIVNSPSHTDGEIRLETRELENNPKGIALTGDYITLDESAEDGIAIFADWDRFSATKSFSVELCPPPPDCTEYRSSPQNMHYVSPTAGWVYFALQAVCGEEPFNVHSENRASGATTSGYVRYTDSNDRTSTRVNCFSDVGKAYKARIKEKGHPSQGVRLEGSPNDGKPWGTLMQEGEWYDLVDTIRYSFFADYYDPLSRPYIYSYPFTVEVCSSDFEPDPSPTVTPSPTPPPTETPTFPPTPTGEPPQPTSTPYPTATSTATATPDPCPQLECVYTQERLPTYPLSTTKVLTGQFDIIGNPALALDAQGNVLREIDNCAIYQANNSTIRFSSYEVSYLRYCIGEPGDDADDDFETLPTATSAPNLNVTANVNVNVTANVNVNVTVENNVTVVVQMPTGTAYNPGPAPTAGTGVALAPGVGAIIAPTKNASPMPAWGFEYPTSQALITPTLSTDVISSFEEINNDIATPAQMIAMASTNFSLQKGQEQAATVACMIEPGLAWVSVMNPSDTRHEDEGTVLWALAPILVPLLPIIIAFFIIYLIKFLLWLADWVLKLVNLILSILKLIRG